MKKLNFSGGGDHLFKILPLFKKIKFPTVFEVRTSESVGLSYTRYATEIYIQDWRFIPFYNAFKCNVLSLKKKLKSRGV